jgi:hypothetical protein
LAAPVAHLSYLNFPNRMTMLHELSASQTNEEGGQCDTNLKALPRSKWRSVGCPLASPKKTTTSNSMATSSMRLPPRPHRSACAGGKRPVTEVCAEYLNLLEQMVAHCKAQRIELIGFRRRPGKQNQWCGISGSPQCRHCPKASWSSQSGNQLGKLSFCP